MAKNMEKLIFKQKNSKKFNPIEPAKSVLKPILNY